MSSQPDPVAHVSAAEARRIAVAASGLARKRPAGRVDRRHLDGVIDRLGLLQLDSVNVVGRAHDLVLFSRLGPHGDRLLRDSAYRRRDLVEAWCHEASLVPMAHWSLLSWRRTAVFAGRWWTGWAEAHQDAIAAAEAQVRDRGPLTASEMEGDRPARGAWWGWDDTKRALEFLFAVGAVAVSDRTGTTGFERSYDLAERVIPPEVLTATPPPEAEARKALLRIAAKAVGIGTVADLADHHRQLPTVVKPLVVELAEEGELLPVRVEGWKDLAFLHPDADRPRRVAAAALVAPFDPIVWNRKRALRLFGFHYRIEIYTPASKRVHGYYVLPFVLGDRLAARVDAKADRKAGVLRAHAAFGEGHHPEEEVADALADELIALARHHRLGTVEIGTNGDLAAPLSAAIAGRR